MWISDFATNRMNSAGLDTALGLLALGSGWEGDWIHYVNLKESSRLDIALSSGARSSRFQATKTISDAQSFDGLYVRGKRGLPGPPD
jgi:hypothetical protein